MSKIARIELLCDAVTVDWDYDDPDFRTSRDANYSSIMNAEWTCRVFKRDGSMVSTIEDMSGELSPTACGTFSEQAYNALAKRRPKAKFLHVDPNEYSLYPKFEQIGIVVCSDAWEELQYLLDDGEELEAVTIGKRKKDYTPGKSKLMTPSKAEPLMRGWHIMGGYGGFKVEPFRAWSNTHVCIIGGHDGRTWLEKVPRHPSAEFPDICGDGG